MGRRLEKFLLLLRKNFLLQFRRSQLDFVLSFMMPILGLIFSLWLRNSNPPKTMPQTIFKPFCLLEKTELCTNPNSDMPNIENQIKKFPEIAYSPKNHKIEKAMKYFTDLVQVRVISFDNHRKMEEYFTKSESNKTLAALQFEDNLSRNVNLPNNLQVNIRFPSQLRSNKTHLSWNTQLLYDPTILYFGPREFYLNYGATPQYYAEGFLAVQMLTTIFLIGAENDLSTDQIRAMMPIMKMQRFPNPSWIEEPAFENIRLIFSCFIVFGFVGLSIILITMLVMEKENQSKETMKVMGLPNWLLWLSWFLLNFIICTVCSILVLTLMKATWLSKSKIALYANSNTVIILLFFLIYVCSVIAFSFAISVFFSKSNLIQIIGIILTLLSILPALVLLGKKIRLSLKIFFCLLNHLAFLIGFNIITVYEFTGEGIQWDNMWQKDILNENLTLGFIIIMLIIDTLLYLFIAFYVEAVIPGQYGMPKPWNFLFTKNYWLPKSVQKDVENIRRDPPNKGEFYESEPLNLKAGIQIMNLYKIYNDIAVVNNLSLNMYENQITVLLGHNGAGKTTAISMLIGMFPPDQGTAIIGGFDIRTNMDQVRASLGICPQHNVIFDNLTVKDHFNFYCKLKGLKGKDVENETQRYINMLDLKSKKNKFTKTLSGGMKRKLCTGLALCGNSKVVFLDEPTAGMDPPSRRMVWDILKKEKQGRTILLTTHHMDEADYLGDRIAILRAGQLQCSGSSFFLKKKFGTGYQLIMEKTSKCDPSSVTQLLQKYIPNIKIKTNIGSELSYGLAESQISIFEQMLYDLESNSSRLGVQSIGISLSTLEEVFMKVGEDKSEDKKRSNTNASVSKTLVKLKIPSSSGINIIKTQILAMLLKRSLTTFRSWLILLITIIIPLIQAIIFGCLSNPASIENTISPKLSINLEDYDEPITLIQDNTNNDILIRTLKDVVSPFRTESVSNINETMLQLIEKHPSKILKHYIVGGSFSKNGDKYDIISWFNNNPYHTPPLSLGLILNAIYKVNLGIDRNINFINFPLTSHNESQKDISKDVLQVMMAMELKFIIVFSITFIIPYFIFFYVKEMVSVSKHLQFISGVNIFIFWFISYMWDLFIFLIIIFPLLIAIFALKISGYQSFLEIVPLLVYLLAFALALLPTNYLFSFLFKDGISAYMILNMVYTLFGFGFALLQTFTDEKKQKNTPLKKLMFLLMPFYSLPDAINNMQSLHAISEICSQYLQLCMVNSSNSEEICWNILCNNYAHCCNRSSNYYAWKSPGIGKHLAILFFEGIVFFLLLIITEVGFFKKICTLLLFKKPKDPKDEDPDVKYEREKIQNTPMVDLNHEYMLVLKNVTKYYRNLTAINGICLGVKHSECFGLLGLNGAGKTTTFKIMTGEVSMSYGNVWVNGYSIKKNMNTVRELTGYCPQFDALFDDLTVRESLRIYLLLRGVSWKNCKHYEDQMGKDFDFTKHMNKTIQQLSGGNKRKVSTAVAFIGDPVIIYLDEPTAGMDPATKRYLWNIICKTRDAGTSIILTSHSMEECEALCTRLAIMVNGQFQSLGSLQHLKNKFAKGFILTLKLQKSIDGIETKQSDIDNSEAFVMKNFRNVEIIEKHQELMIFQINDTNTSWSKLFNILEKNRKNLNIEDYSLGQLTLEQVFLSFTKVQK